MHLIKVLYVSITIIILLCPCYAKTNSIDLPIRYIEHSADPENYETEFDIKYGYKTWKLNLNETALILIDVWEEHPNDGFSKRMESNIEERILPLLEVFRRHDILIIHAPHSKKLASAIDPQLDEYVVNYSAREKDWNAASYEAQLKLSNILSSHNITTLLYAGYSTNICLLDRKTGIPAMKALGYNTILIRDCTLALETSETIGEEMMKKTAVNIIEVLYGPSTTSEDLIYAIEGSSSRADIGYLILILITAGFLFFYLKNTERSWN